MKTQAGNFDHYHALHSDSRAGKYNAHSDDLGYGNGSYHHNGNFSVWAGPKGINR